MKYKIIIIILTVYSLLVSYVLYNKITPRYNSLELNKQFVENSIKLEFQENVSNVIPDADTAYLIADKVLRNYFGESMKDEQPLNVTYVPEDGLWLVNGTLRNYPNIITAGGVAVIVLRQEDGKVVSIYHGR